MVWKIEYTESAKKQLRKLDKPTARQIVDYLDTRIAQLNDPRNSGRALAGPLGGLWRYRVGDYRVICELQDDVLTTLVLQIGNRCEVYR